MIDAIAYAHFPVVVDVNSSKVIVGIVILILCDFIDISLPHPRLRISFEAPWAHPARAGSYLFVMLPELGPAEWHPVSIAACTPRGRGKGGGQLVTLMVSVASPSPSWSGRLRDMVRELCVASQGCVSVSTMCVYM